HADHLAALELVQVGQAGEHQPVGLDIDPAHRGDGDLGVRQAAEHLVRTGEIELGDPLIERKDDTERLGHRRPPGIGPATLPRLWSGRNDILPSISAMTRKIGLLIFPDFQLLDAAGPIAAFEIASRFSPGAYALEALARVPGLVAPPSGAAMLAGALEESALDPLLVAGADGSRHSARCPATLDWLRRGARRARRTASVCSGAYLLAEAGLL